MVGTMPPVRPMGEAKVPGGITLLSSLLPGLYGLYAFWWVSFFHMVGKRLVFFRFLGFEVTTLNFVGACPLPGEGNLDLSFYLVPPAQ